MFASWDSKNRSFLCNLPNTFLRTKGYISAENGVFPRFFHNQPNWSTVPPLFDTLAHDALPPRRVVFLCVRPLMPLAWLVCNISCDVVHSVIELAREVRTEIVVQDVSIAFFGKPQFQYLRKPETATVQEYVNDLVSVMPAFLGEVCDEIEDVRPLCLLCFVFHSMMPLVKIAHKQQKTAVVTAVFAWVLIKIRTPTEERSATWSLVFGSRALLKRCLARCSVRQSARKQRKESLSFWTWEERAMRSHVSFFLMLLF